jgi:hypothetical protein
VFQLLLDEFGCSFRLVRQLGGLFSQLPQGRLMRLKPFDLVFSSVRAGEHFRQPHYGVFRLRPNLLSTSQELARWALLLTKQFRQIRWRLELYWFSLIWKIATFELATKDDIP